MVNLKNSIAALFICFAPMLSATAAYGTNMLPTTKALEVSTKVSFTGRMCAASRYIESQRSDSLFTDPISRQLAGPSGMKQPMGEWILVPRTRFGDDFLAEKYNKRENPCRQLVLLGAGMDARAFRLDLPELRVFEVDQPTNFQVKEAVIDDLARNASSSLLTVKERQVVGFDFDSSKGHSGSDAGNTWDGALEAQGFDRRVPTVWLLEGLLYYLHESDVADVMKKIGQLSAKGSAVFHDSITASYVSAGIAPGGAPFVSGSDDYAGLWREEAGFDTTFVRDFSTVSVNRSTRSLQFGSGGELPPAKCRGRDRVLFVTSEKSN